jgi:hypothetical protein
MAVRLLILGALLALLAGCGGGGGGGPKEEDDEEDLARRAQAFPETLASRLPPYTLRYPSTLKRAAGSTPPGPVVLRRRDGASCTITAAGPLPDVAKESALEDYLQEPPGGPAPPPPGEIRRERGADDVEGASLMRRPPGGSSVVLQGLMQTAGRGVAVTCDAPRAEARNFDRLVFRPMLASVRLRPDFGLERLQRNLLVVPGVTRASLVRRGERRVSGVVEFSPNLRTRTALRQAMARTLLTAADGSPADRVRLTSVARNGLPMSGVVYPAPPLEPGKRPRPGAGEMVIGGDRIRFAPPEGLRRLAGVPESDSYQLP